MEKREFGGTGIRASVIGLPELWHIDPGSAALLVMDYQVDALTKFMTAARQPVRWHRPGELLRANGIATLVLDGVHTSGAVLSTVRHAGELDYLLVVVRDCCAAPDAEVHAMLLDIVIAKQATVVTTAELAGALSGRSSCKVKSKES
jgi:Isochorismatase family